MEGDQSYHGRRIQEEDFNPLPPHGGRPDREYMYFNCERISIHSLRMEGDLVGFSVP